MSGSGTKNSGHAMRAPVSTPATRPIAALRGQDLVEECFGFVLVGALGERELADEDLPGLGEHALLAGGQAALTVAAPQVADDLRDLVDVTGGDLLDVGLVAAGPVG